MSEPETFLEALNEATDAIAHAHERYPRRNDETSRRWWPLWLRNAIIERDGGCRGCGRSWGPFEIDHVYPRSMFRARDTHWADRSVNLQTLCVDCNASKSNRRVKFPRRPCISCSCVVCAPPDPDYDDPTKRWPCWCIKCGVASVVPTEQDIH